MSKALDKPANWAREMRDRKPPRVLATRTPDGILDLGLEGDWARILKAVGSLPVANGLMVQATRLGSHGTSFDQEATDFVIGFVDTMQPKDAAETLLLAQMAATHQAMMMLANRLNRVETIPQQDAAERALNKLARTYAGQMETLKRYRSKAQQTVRVERVTVENGGQAVVGNVEHRGTR